MNRSPFGNHPFVQQDELRRQFESNQVQFVLTELDMAATFCDVASSASDPTTFKRNVANARTAYDTALKFSRNAHFEPASQSEFEKKLSSVKASLIALGEPI